jgi:L-lactate dehydrogenase (cytochrome)
MLAPAGLAGLVHPDGEQGVADAAARHGLLMVMSGAATYTIEEVVASGAPPPWYQLYLWRSRAFYTELIERAAAAGVRGLVVTVDTGAKGRKEKDLANGLTVPPRLTVRNGIDILGHPRWVAGTIRGRRVVVKAFDGPAPPPLGGLVARASGSADMVTGQMVAATWSELEWIRSVWHGPLAIKGILAPADARRAVELGAQVVMVSNHGGRQLDGVVASLDALAAVVDEVAGALEVVVDGGIRRGTHVLKALCLGARACMIGRPWVYGLGAGGGPGVAAVLAQFREELTVALTLLGAPDVGHLDRSFLAGAPGAI